MTSIIETEGLTKNFGAKNVVDHVNLQVPQGSIFGLAGPNGAGKSTLLKLLIGYYWPTSGIVRLFGEEMSKEVAQAREYIQLVSSEWDVFKTFRIDDLIKYYGLLYKQFDKQRCMRLLRALELPLRARVRNLSLGMKTQLRIALALASHPKVLLLDEPTNGLDPVVKRQFLQLLVQEAAVDGTTILLATHHLDDLDRIAEGVAIMHKGRLLVSDSLDALKTMVKEIHCILPNGLPDGIRRLPELLSFEQKGQLYTFTVNGSPEFLLQSLHTNGALHLEVMDLPFDELFLKLMEQEGYTRDKLLL